jgi:N-terminal acetyltransferase B complex non-catalytic subunit
LWSFLKIYIRAFQHASDLDDIVEEKLLIGDRPKKSSDPEVQLPLGERLAIRKPEEAAEVNSYE